MAFAIREMTDADRRGVEAIDTSFETSSILDVVVTARRIDLVERVLDQPIVKRYPIADAFAPWSTWDTAWVAERRGIIGFAAVEYEAWHRRLVLWHLYVSPPSRRIGVGRALLARAEEHGRSLRAKTVWLETSNVNVPGIAAYERLGYSLCGADVTLYDQLPYANERALYLSKAL
ncbi:MAG TPA: GNAT family N-acetyltransferase [Kofleriaceae bacterium]